MNTINNIDQLLEDFIKEERNTEPNPFLSTRIMAAVERRGGKQLLPLSPAWKIAVIAASLFVAVFSGITAGNLYQPKNNAADAVLINDDSIENFGWYAQIGNE
ncbi:MAG: hypothetical protein JNN00_09445 [Chitinophagaceae bacterium]|nr:hypothetical protein [Chitinophagaceae bacterium]